MSIFSLLIRWNVLLVAIGISIAVHCLLLFSFNDDFYFIKRSEKVSEYKFPKLYIKISTDKKVNIIEDAKFDNNFPSAIDIANNRNNNSTLKDASQVRPIDKLGISVQDSTSLNIDVAEVEIYFYEKYELNRFPVLSLPFSLDHNGLENELRIGYADFWIYISKAGNVVDVISEFSSLSPTTLNSVIQQLKKSHFTPGYVSGEPVASKIRWRVIVESNTGFTSIGG